MVHISGRMLDYGKLDSEYLQSNPTVLSRKLPATKLQNNNNKKLSLMNLLDLLENLL